ncbi:hypothetical protein QE401_000348 [Pseudoroseomonas cervicalis]|nr:hypothetical protein [Pseudoroseomonas cervicalis]
MGQAELSAGQRGRGWVRPSPAERALDGWLRDGLQRRYGAPPEEETPAELLDLLDREALRLGGPSGLAN